MLDFHTSDIMLDFHTPDIMLDGHTSDIMWDGHTSDIMLFNYFIQISFIDIGESCMDLFINDTLLATISWSCPEIPVNILPPIARFFQ